MVVDFNRRGGSTMIDSEQFHGGGGGIVITRSFRVGGMNDPDAGAEIEDTIGKIDGVKNVTADRVLQVVSVEFDPGAVSQEWITRTLNTMGHSILAD